MLKNIPLFSHNLIKSLFYIQIVYTFAVLFKKGMLADVAQLVEQLICNQLVGGSNPSIGSDLVYQERKNA